VVDDPGVRVLAILGAIIFLAVGVGLLLFVRQRWYGRYRQWSVNDTQGSFIVYSAPAMAVGALLGAITLICLVVVPVRIVSQVLLAGALLTPMVGIFASAIKPRWWGPRWYHQVRLELFFPNREEYDPVIEVRQIDPEPGAKLSSSELAADMFDGQPIADRCRCYFIQEPNKGLRKYGVRHVLSWSGALEIRSTGLAFVPGRFTEKMRGGPHVIPVEAEAVQRVWVVPPGAEPDGYRRVGLPREIWSRIVVKTEDETFLFSVPQAQERAKTISEVLGCPLGT
jgi:hypothetical protein